MRSLVVVVLAVFALVRSGAAQSSGAQAEALFREGRALLAAGKIAEACQAFEQSEKVDPKITTLLNIAGCREKNGQVATAWGIFLDAERQTRNATDEATQQLHAIALEHSNQLANRVPKLIIHVDPENRIFLLEILRGKERIEEAMWNHPLPVDGGTYTITARAPGAQPWSVQVEVAPESDTKTVDVPKLEAPTPEAPRSETEMTTSTYKLRRKWKTAAVSLAVGGLVVGAAGAVLQIIASSDPAVGLQCFPNPDRTDNMHGNYTCNGDYYKADYASLDKRLETRHISQIAAIGAFVLGPSALIAAVGILYFGPRDPVFVPVASHDTVGFAFEKRF